MQEIQFPEHVREAPARVDVRVEKKLMDTAKQVLDSIEIDWDKLDPSDEMLARFRDIAARSETIQIDNTSEPVSTGVVDLMEALKASVDATKGKAK